MATLNQFQQYSQGENTATNNVLLMLSRLYDCSSTYYEEFINSLIEGTDTYQVIPNFRQQVNNHGNGFIDGHITTKPTRIIIETKLWGLEGQQKLLKYTQSFRKDELQILLHLSQDVYDEEEVKGIREELKSKEHTSNAQFHSITYETLVDGLNGLKDRYPHDPQLSQLASHFEAYCQNMSLLPVDKHVLRAMACGQSYELNKKYQFYFDLTRRGYSNFKYLGIYKDKAVRHIGLVENRIEAYYEDGKLHVTKSDSPVTDAQRARLKAAIEESLESGWDVDYDHRFFLLKDFSDTHYEKTSSGGIFRVRYFNLEDELGGEVPESVAEIAEKLKSLTWE